MRPVKQFAWGAAGGLMPILVSIWRLAQASPLDAPIPTIGGLAVVAAMIAPLVGAIASRGFEAHSILAALYHGATAPLTFAFVFGIDTHIVR